MPSGVKMRAFIKSPQILMGSAKPIEPMLTRLQPLMCWAMVFDHDLHFEKIIGSPNTTTKSFFLFILNMAPFVDTLKPGIVVLVWFMYQFLDFFPTWFGQYVYSFVVQYFPYQSLKHFFDKNSLKFKICVQFLLKTTYRK